MTWVMPSISMPRAAMSVATRTRILPARKFSSALWRAVCDLLPWIASAPIWRLARSSATLLAPCLVRLKHDDDMGEGLEPRQPERQGSLDLAARDRLDAAAQDRK